jgi:alanyl-tRNA synthetase
VFTQFEKMENGDYVPLKNPNIDTGMGLERLAIMMQGVDSFFDIDTMQIIRDEICKKANVTYQANKDNDVSIRVITDHIRSVTFMTSDGILPSNEGRGYVLRRLLRRAARHGKLLGIQGKFLKDLAQIVIESSKDGYPELKEKEAYILKVLTTEEERFAETIDQGIAILNEYLDELGDQKVLSGEKAFKLYDTYGFPLDLTIEIAEEKGVTVDQEAFAEEMKAQRDRARNAREESNYMGAKETVYHQLDIGIGGKFVGYQQLQLSSEITGLTQGSQVVTSISSGAKVSLLVHETPFYATSGGQEADIGFIETATGKVRVDDVIKVVGNNIAHIGEVIEGDLEIGQEAILNVDEDHRFATAKNHSATHLLQKALKTVLGDHIEQAGSSVSAERLRFDFTHFEAIPKKELQKIEDIVNAQIQKGLGVHIEEMPIAKAKELGAMALFGEKYGDTVRVVNIDGYSIELCGGTHLSNISEIGLFKIVSEGGVAAGVRRIEALTGQGAINYYHSIEHTLNAIADIARCEVGQVETRIQSLLDDMKELKRENDQLKSKAASSIVDDLLKEKKKIKEVEVVVNRVEGFDANRLRDLGDKLQDRLSNGVVVLASDFEGKVLVSVMASDNAVKQGAHAGKTISTIAKLVGGGGGGKPQIAQAGGRDVTKINEALDKAIELLGEQLNA